MQRQTYSPLKYLAAADTTLQPEASSGGGAAPAPAPGPEFVWQRADRAAAAPESGPDGVVSQQNSRLAAAADLARRFAQLGVHPPLPAAPTSAQVLVLPQQLQVPPAHPAAALPSPQAQTDRLEALVEHMKQQSSVLAGAVQGQSRQLAVQQALLADVVQGLLFVGAKTSAAGAKAPGSLAGGLVGQQQPTAAAASAALASASTPAPAKPASAPLSPRRTAAVVQGLAAKLRPAVGDGVRGSRNERSECGRWALDVPSGGDGTAGACTGRPASPACGMLRVPVVPPGDHDGGAGPGGAGLCGSEAEEAGSEQVLLSARSNRYQHPAETRRPAAEQAHARADTAAHAAPLFRRSSGSGSVQPARPRPAWNDRTAIVAERPRGRQASEMLPPPPGRHLVGGLGPQLLLQELRRLQRRRSTGGSSVGGGSVRKALRSSPQEAARPVTAPAASAGGRQAATLSTSRQCLQQAKDAAAVGLLGTSRAAAASLAAEEDSSRRGSAGQLQASRRRNTTVAAAGAGAVESVSEAVAAPPLATLPPEAAAAPASVADVAVAKAWQASQPLAGPSSQPPAAATVADLAAEPPAQPPQQTQQQAASSSRGAKGPALAGAVPVLCWEALSEQDVDAVCERICRQLLLSECAPCSSVPVC